MIGGEITIAAVLQSLSSTETSQLIEDDAKEQLSDGHSKFGNGLLAETTGYYIDYYVD